MDAELYPSLFFKKVLLNQNVGILLHTVAFEICYI